MCACRSPAIAGFTLAVGSHWSASDGTQSGTLSAHQAVARIQRKLASAKRLGIYHPGGPGASKPAALVYWRADDNSDAQMQFTELAMLRFNPTTRTIDLYQPQLLDGQTDDIWDAGDTVREVARFCREQGALSVRSAVLLIKDRERSEPGLPASSADRRVPARERPLAYS